MTIDELIMLMLFDQVEGAHPQARRKLGAARAFGYNVSIDYHRGAGNQLFMDVIFMDDGNEAHRFEKPIEKAEIRDRLTAKRDELQAQIDFIVAEGQRLQGA